MQEILYAQGYLDLKPVLSQADTKLLQTTPTLAAGDFKLRNASQAFTNIASVAAAFTSGGTAIPLVGETLTGATSTFTAIVVGFFLTSGSWGAGTAAGTLFVEQTSGAFTPGENLNGSVGGANILTLTADFVAQPTALAQTGSGGAAVPIISAEATTDRLQVARVDAAGAEWCSDWLEYITTDHPSAGKPNSCIASVAAHASSQTATNIRLNAAPQATPIAGFFVVCTAVGSAPMFGVIESYSTAGGQYNITLYDGMPAALTSAWTVAVYGDAAAAAARIVATENIDLSATQKTSVRDNALLKVVAVPTTPPALGTDTVEALLAWLLHVRGQLAKKDMNEVTGVEQVYNQAGSAAIASATHSKSGNTTTVNKLA